MKEKIMEILRGLMAQKSITNTEAEILAENWMTEYFRSLPYFQKFPERCGLFPLPDDPLRRSAVWALVTAEGVAGSGDSPMPSAAGSDAAPKSLHGKDVCGEEKQLVFPTVILMGHHDVVSADVYGAAADWAFDPDTITAHLDKDTLSSEAYTDLLSGEWIFGRGSCDMLGGTAVQMAVLAEEAEAILANPAKELPEVREGAGSVNQITADAPEKTATAPENASCRPRALLFVSVPDEESFSVGMRGTLPLLETIKERFRLDYCLAVCAEPNRRIDDGKTQVVSEGSIGKLLPVVLVQGKLVQIGSYQDGVNPLGILSRIVAATEGDENFTEEFAGERSVPPVWMYARDLKDGYDFSLPQWAAGYCNVLSFHKTPAQVMAYFLAKIKGATENMQHPVSVMTWVTLWQQARQHTGFVEFVQDVGIKMETMLSEHHKTFPEVTLWLMQRTLDFLQTDKPLVLLGFAPPYYPAVRSEELKGAERFAKYKKALAGWQSVRFEPYFAGVSDCSYCGIPDGKQSPVYQANTPLWGKFYQFDMAALSRLQIPFLLLGPWGKDLHQIGERVNRYSLTKEYPDILKKLLQFVWLSE